MSGTELSPRRTAARRLSVALADPLAYAIVALGITQIIAWGTTLYALGVLGKPIAIDTGWSQGLVYGGLTLGLLVAGGVSVPVGRWLDRRGGREVMSLGSVLAAASLALLSVATTPAFYLIAWALAGLAMRMTLYDAAFAALVQLAPTRGRRAISYLTLFGGLASTLLWPAGAALEYAFGWRSTLLIFAALNLGICLPLHWCGLRRSRATSAANSSASAAPAVPPAPPLQGTQRTWAMVLFSVVMAASAFVTGAMAVHLVPILAAQGLDPRWAVVLASAKGVAQTLARLVDLVFGRNLHAMMLGRLTIALLPVAFLALLAGGSGFATAALFVALFGAANGLATIVRGAVPLALFGANGYGEVLGRLATPVLFTNAVAPMLFAVVAERYGLRLGVSILACVSVLAVVAMEIMGRWYRRTQV